MPDPCVASRKLALDLVDAGLEAADPARCTRESLACLEERGLDLRSGLWVLALGKAARPMAEAVVDVASVQGGFVLGPAAVGPGSGSLGPLHYLPAGHPLPADAAVEHGQRVLDWARGLGAGDQVLCLVSGGGSSMLELPAVGLSLDDLRQVSRVLLGSGLAIAAVNAVRTALSQVKGGRLLQALAPARVANIVVSDVVSGPLSMVASGPSLPLAPGPPALLVVREAGLEDQLSAKVLDVLRCPDGPSAATAPHPAPVTVTAADNRSACEALAAEAGRQGRTVAILPEPITGLAAEAGADFVRRSRSLGVDVVIGGGETTVRVRGPGRGGRNHEFVLGALSAWDGGLVASLGTDGVDGTSGAAGALVDEWVVDGLGKSPSEDPSAALRDNDSGALLERLGAQLITGPTGTNVADVCLYVAGPSSS